MPRKTSKKDTTESKNEGVTPRRSGRAVTAKQEIAPVKDASRSRRSSTAAQTVASVADSKSPRGRSSRRESTSPSDARSRSGREEVAARQSARRSTGRVNYKESDGEEETPAPKYEEETFESGEEFEESDSDEKVKLRGKGRQTKASTKSRESKEKADKGTRSRRGRPSKKKAEEPKTLEISDDSMEPEIVETKPAKTVVKGQTTSRPSRGRKSKSEVVELEPEIKPKPSRRSVRSTSNKEDTPKKRPSRSVQAKRYTEDDEEDIEEITDSKTEEESEKQESSRKRKRSFSPEEVNKRAKEEEEVKEVKEEEENGEEPVTDDKTTSECLSEEPMEVEECDSGIVSQDDTKSQESEDISISPEEKREASLACKKQTEKSPEPKDVTNMLPTSLESTEKMEETPPEAEPETPPECDSKTSEIVEEKKDDDCSTEVVSEKEPENQTAVSISDKSEIDDFESVESTTLKSETAPASDVAPETNSNSMPTKSVQSENKDLKSNETQSNDVNDSKSNETEDKTATLNTTSESIVPVTNAHSVTASSDNILNRGEKLSNSISTSPALQVPNLQSDSAVPKANGAHDDVHDSSTNSVQEHFILPGRKYVLNSKLNENILQSLKNKTFGFLSLNLGSDFNIQKEKLLHELRELNSQIICFQQVPKPFFSSVLEPSLDALGFKSIFSQPGDSLKGIATFYKSSHFRLSDQTEISLSQLIDKELETSALEPTSKSAVKLHIKKCGNALLTHFVSVIGTQAVNVVNVQIPPSDLSTHALQVSCLAREVIRINGGTNKPLLIGGEFNISENDASYQLLRDGYLSNDMIDELQQRKDVAVPEKENSSLVDLLWKSFQHPSSNLCSCYSSVLGRELLIPELKSASSDLLWYSSDSLHTLGVVDVDSNKLGDHHFSLKAEIAFSV